MPTRNRIGLYYCDGPGRDTTANLAVFYFLFWPLVGPLTTALGGLANGGGPLRVADDLLADYPGRRGYFGSAGSMWSHGWALAVKMSIVGR